MENRNWNLDEWQGKRKDQVSFSNKVTFMTILIGFMFGFLTFILYLCGVL